MFGVKNSLVVDLKKVTDPAMAEKYGVKIGDALLEYDFVLVSEAEALQLREEKAREAMAAQGRNVVLLDGLPVPDLD